MKTVLVTNHGNGERAMNNEVNEFGKKQTTIMKGVAVCLMLIHHLFYDQAHIEKCRLVSAGGGDRFY